MNRVHTILSVLSGLVLFAPPLFADDITEQEVLFLIESVAQSGCTFERNGKTYEAEAAADHLSLKYRRGRKYANSAENFIDRLASKSSLSGKAYYIACSDNTRVTSGSWLHQRLLEKRQAQDSAY